MQVEKRWRTTKGFNGEVFVAPAGSAYPDTATVDTLAEFLALTDGTMQIFNADTNALLDDVAGVAGTNIYIGQVRGGEFFRSRPFTLKAGTVKKEAYVAPVKPVITLDFTGVVPAAGQDIVVTVIEATPGYKPLPTWQYAYTVKTGQTLAQVMTALAAVVNSVSYVGNEDPGIVTAAATATGMTLTAKAFDVNFNVASAGSMGSLAVKTITTAFVGGQGTFNQVTFIEDEGAVFAGYTADYATQTMGSHFGTRTKYASSAVTYDVFTVNGVNESLTNAGAGKNSFPVNMVLAVAAGSALSTSLTTALVI